MSDMTAVLMADELPMDVAGAEAVLTNHLEHKGEMDARQDSFDVFALTGRDLVDEGHYASHEVWTVDNGYSETPQCGTSDLKTLIQI